MVKRLNLDIRNDNIEKIFETLIEDNGINKYEEVARLLKDEKGEKEIIQILKDNFDVATEEFGRFLLKKINLFDPDNGEIVSDLPTFIGFTTIPVGFKMITNHTYPLYDIKNKYMGHIDEGKFNKLKNPRIIWTGKNYILIWILTILLLIYMLIKK